MYRLTSEDKQLLNNLFKLKDLNEAEGYKKDLIEHMVNTQEEFDSDVLNQIRNYVMDKNLEYGFDDDEPNELGCATEELADRLYDVLEADN